jgi:uncharacterized protein (TIGR03663 family)
VQPASGKKRDAPAIRPAETSALAESAEVSERTWRLSAVVIVIAGAFLRLYALSLVPLHHDEGVNGNFLVTLVRNGTYQYDPQNYHGPTLYYFSAIIPWVVRFFGGKSAGDAYGLTTFNIRLVTAAFGVATIWLALLLRKRLGTVGALSAAGLIAISPGAVYLSRYFIHESLFVFFTLGIVVAALEYYDTTRSVYLILTVTSAALMVATKETWVMNGPVLLIALVTTSVYFWLRAKLNGNSKRKSSEPAFAERARLALARFGGPIPLATVALAGFTVFILVDVLFYSSFFTNYPKGVHDALQTLKLWSHRTHEHEHPWWQYVEWLSQEEAALLFLSAAGALVAVWRARNRLAVFVALWAFGLLAAYSLVGYKTPWITLNFILPLAIIGGYALEVAYQKLREFDQPRLFIALAIAIAALCVYQMYQLNFVHYDDDKYPYVYAHTRREMLSLVEEIDKIGKRMGTGTDTGIALVSPDYWPLPWYFRDYQRVGYYQQIVPTTEPIIIGSTAEEEQLKSTYGDRYQLVNSGLAPDGSYALRPGVDLLLYVRKDVAK